jgi:hypothetical protein
VALRIGQRALAEVLLADGQPDAIASKGSYNIALPTTQRFYTIIYYVIPNILSLIVPLVLLQHIGGNGAASTARSSPLYRV